MYSSKAEQVEVEIEVLAQRREVARSTSERPRSEGVLSERHKLTKPRMEEHSLVFKVFEEIWTNCGNHTTDLDQNSHLQIHKDGKQNEFLQTIVAKKNLCYASVIAPRETQEFHQCLQKEGNVQSCKESGFRLWTRYNNFWNNLVSQKALEDFSNMIPDRCVEITKKYEQLEALPDPTAEDISTMEETHQELMECVGTSVCPTEYHALKACEKKHRWFPEAFCAKEQEDFVRALALPTVAFFANDLNYSPKDMEAVAEEGVSSYFVRIGKILHASQFGTPEASDFQ